ncbi:MAG: hypothetical protein RLZZ196_521 [Bacteroidota bacterium]
MTKSGKSFPKDVIDCWPEVFGEIKLHVLPLRYLNAVLITFKDGKIWEIKITQKIKREGWDSFEKSLSELHKSYERRIDNIDFKLDTDRIRKDVEKVTSKFLKERKLK